MTDDDCVVASNFVRIMIEEMQADSAVTLVFADVLEPIERSEVWTPINRAQNSYSVNKVKEWKSNDGVNVGIVPRWPCARMQSCRWAASTSCSVPCAFPQRRGHRSRVADTARRRTHSTHHKDLGVSPRESEHRGDTWPHSERNVRHRRRVRQAHPVRPLDAVGYLWTVFRATVLVSGFDELKRGRRPPVLRRAAQLARGLMAGARVIPRFARTSCSAAPTLRNEMSILVRPNADRG